MYEAIVIIFAGVSLFFYICWRAIKFECTACTCKYEKKITPIYAVITVKNSEDCIEGVIHSIIKEMKTTRDVFSPSGIVVVDLGSCDSTVQILEKLTSKYEYIYILQSSSYLDIVGH